MLVVRFICPTYKYNSDFLEIWWFICQRQVAIWSTVALIEVLKLIWWYYSWFFACIHNNTGKLLQLYWGMIVWTNLWARVQLVLITDITVRFLCSNSSFPFSIDIQCYVYIRNANLIANSLHKSSLM